jgi:putative ABC transport system permease protein
MIAHLAKLAWNRKRANALTIVEVTASFVVLFAVTTLAVAYFDNWRHPLGFSVDNVLNVGVDVRQNTDDVWTPEQVERTRMLLQTVREMPEVESAACALTIPYEFASSTGGRRVNGLVVEFERDEVTDDFAKVFKLEVTRGRWFSREDDAAQISPIVINERYAKALFGDEDPIGKVLDAEEPEYSQRVVGVVSEFRKGGEFAQPGNIAFDRANLNDPKVRPPRNIAVRVRPGTSADFEEKLATRMQNTVREWGFDVRSIANIKEESNRFRVTPLVIGALVSAFLLIMVGLGITGVLWQSVTKRTKEIGLRRVAGATVRDVFIQIVGELLVVTTVAVVIGLAVVVQVPLLDLVSAVSPTVYTLSIVTSVAVVYLLAFGASLYPSWLATRIQPVEALRYE